MNTTARVLFCLFIACAAVWGQASTAQINGNVRDASGLAVPAATIEVKQMETGATRTANSGADGSFILPNLPVGPYTLEVSKEGFAKYVQTGIQLEVNGNPTIDAPLKVGSISDQVTVQADASMVETHSSGVGQVVDSQRVVELPLNGRQPTQLVFLAGLATVANGGSLNTSGRNYPTVAISVAGGQATAITYLLDGGTHNDPFNNLNLPLPFPDALQEFKVETSALPAQYGFHSAAAINAVTKSGTNAYHGDAFEFVRNKVFNARDFFAVARDTLKRNQYGGTFGGPVRKDKLFFFVGLQDSSLRSDPSQTIAYVPTPTMLAGDFTTAASPACNGGRQITLPASLGFVGNRISTSSLSPQALKLTSLLPGSADPCGRVTYGLRVGNDEQLGVARADYQVNANHSLFGRLLLARLNQLSGFDGKNPLTFNGAPFFDRAYSVTLGDTYLIGAGTVSSFRATVTRTSIEKIPDSAPSLAWASLGVQNVAAQVPNYSKIAVSGNGFSYGSVGETQAIYNTGANYQVAEDVGLVRGAHQFGFGVNYLHSLLNVDSGLNATGGFTFNGSVTGLSMADFLVGSPSAWSQGSFTLSYNRENYIALYAQDTWKLNSRLTVSYGIRWEPYIAPHSKYGWFTHFDPALFAQNVHSSVFVKAPAGLIFPGDSQYTPGSSIENPTMGVVVPRMGIVWDPQGTGRMTVRASYGMLTDRQSLDYYNVYASSPPFGNTITVPNPSFVNPWANYPGGNPFPAALSPNFTFPAFGSYGNQQLNPKPTYLNQWNLSVQRQIGTSWLVTVNYLGNSTIHLWSSGQANVAVYLPGASCVINGTTFSPCSTTGNVNQRRLLYQQNPAQGQFYGGIQQNDTGGTQTYDGLLFSVQRRLSHGVTVLGNYTWSHCIGDPGSVELSGSGYVIPNQRRTDRSNCAEASDQRQIFNLSVVAQSPKFSSRVLQMLAGDWQLSSIVTAKSSQFFTVTTGVDNALTGQGGQRPNLLLTNPYPANQSVGQWILPTAFAAPAPGTYGNLGAFNLKGPGSVQFDLGLSRMFKIRERQTFQLRAEAFNILNRLNASTPVATLNSGNFGQITSDINGTQGQTGDPRVIQFAFKYIF